MPVCIKGGSMFCLFFQMETPTLQLGTSRGSQSECYQQLSQVKLSWSLVALMRAASLKGQQHWM